MKRAIAWLVAALLGACLRAEAASPYLDPTFGSGGVAPFNSAPNAQSPYPIQLASGRIAMLFAATWFEGGINQGNIYYLSRLDKSGAADATFGTNGVVEVGRYRIGAAATSYFALNGWEDSTGRIVLAGDEIDPSGATGITYLVMKRFQANGAIDATFGSNGTAIFSTLAIPLVGTTLLDYRDLGGGRKLLVAAGSFSGSSGEALAPRSVFVAFNEAGNLDTSFAGTGWLQVDYIVSGVRVDADGSFTASGISTRTIDPQMTFITARYDRFANATGSRTSLSVPWRVTAFQRDGSYVTFPDPGTMEARDFAGNLDPLFGDGGIARENVMLGNYSNVVRTSDGGVAATGFPFNQTAAAYSALVCVWRASGRNDSCDAALDRIDGSPGLSVMLPSGDLYVSGALSASARIARLNVTAPSIEYFNTSLGHYLVTYDGAEARIIDQGGAGPGWSRTGKSFKSGGTTPVCRFYGTPGIGSNSHFFTISSQECDLVKKDPGWTFEGFGLYATPAVNAQCETPLIPVYRLYNNQAAQRNSNHRHVTDLSLVPAMTAQGWSLEGVAFCARP